MNVLFLDIDGVLNSAEWFSALAKANEETGAAFDNGVLDPKAVKVLNTVLARTGAKVVVSSTWRKLYDFEDLKELLAKQGVDTSSFIGKTGNSMDGHRGREIAAWLEANDVDNFVAIDDSTDLENLGERHFKTEWPIGLLPEHEDKLVAMLLGDHRLLF